MALTTTATLSSSRCYRVYTSSCLITSTVANDTGQIRILQSAAGGSVGTGSTLNTLNNAPCPIANNALTTVQCSVLIDGPTSGTYQFGIAYQRANGTGNVSLNIATGRALQLVVEDIGPAGLTAT